LAYNPIFSMKDFIDAIC